MQMNSSHVDVIVSGYAGAMAPQFNDYERRQWQRIRRWRARPPSIASRGFTHASGRITRMLSKLVPGVALRTALNLVQSAAIRTADQRAILRLAGVDDLDGLRELPLEACDKLAQRERRNGALLGGGTGTALGLAGGIGLVLDVPTLLLVTFRTIHRVGLCYGEDCADQRLLALGIFALASANTYEEKQSALAALDLERAGDAQGLRNGVARTAEREFAKEAMQFSFKQLSGQFVRRLGWRLGAGALPVVGAAIGGGVNAWFLQQTALAAQHTFQWRRLQARVQDDVSG
jgi:hypothetical protein